MSSYADHQRMVTLEQRVATLEVRAAEAEHRCGELQAAVEALKQRPIPLGGQHALVEGLQQAQAQALLDQSGMHEPPSPASPYEQWRDKKAARKAAE